MAKKKKYDSEDGIWRTVGGRRIFIKNGQDLSSAMKESGKFKTRMNEKAVKGAREEDLKEQYKDSLNNVSKMEYNGEITREEYDKAVKDINKAYIDKRNSYLKGERNYEQVDKEWTDLAKKMEKDYDEFGTTNWKDEAKLNKLSNERDTLQYKENKKEYELYKRAKENPDSIDPMTENSTDWEALDKKYGERFKNDKAKVDLKNAEVMLKGSQRSLEFERDGLARAKRDGQSVENISDRTRRVHELELEVQKSENYYNKLKKERDAYESKVFGSDVTKADEQMKKVFGKDFKYDEEKELSQKKIKSLQHEARKMRKEAEYTTGEDSKEYWKKFDDINEKLGKDRIDINYEYELYKRAKEDYDHFAGWELYSDDPNRFGDKLRKYNNKMNPSKNDALNKVKNNRIVENVKSGDRFYEIGNGQWRSEKDGYDYYIDFNSSNIDNPKYRDVASGRIINTNPRADNYWDYEGDGLKSKYKGTIDYLRKTTNMNGAEILELLRQIDKDKK